MDLGDVDLLTSRESAESLGARDPFAPLRSDRHVLALELHARFDYSGAPTPHPSLAVAPIRDCTALDQLNVGAALPATLRHTVVAHPHRRGHLRDLFLLANMVRQLGDSYVSALDGHLEHNEWGIKLRSVLTQARNRARGDGPLDDPPATRPFVIWKYAIGVARALRAAYRLTLFACITAAGAMIRRHIRLLDPRTGWG